jgi:hypothetical protein
MYMHGAFPAISGASGVKIWHPLRIGREKGSEEGRGRGKDWEGRKQRRHAVSIVNLDG